MDTRVVVDGLDITIATSLKELLESSGIPCELIGGHSAFSGVPQMGGYGLVVPAERYDEARHLIDEIEAGQGLPPRG